MTPTQHATLLRILRMQPHGMLATVIARAQDLARALLGMRR